MRRHAAIGLLVIRALLPPPSGAESTIGFTHQTIALPAAPAAIVPGDVDGDGRIDLSVVVVDTVWDRIAVEETTAIDEVDGLVEVLTIVPALLEKRELHVFRAGDEGYEPVDPPLELDRNVITLVPAPELGAPVAWTDEGVATVELVEEESVWTPALRTLFQVDSALAGAGTFFPGLELVRELDGNPGPELLIPASEGLMVFPGRAAGGWADDRRRVAYPKFTGPSADGVRGPGERLVPWPESRDVTGDGLPDLLFRHPSAGWDEPLLAANLGGGHFERPRPAPGLAASENERIVYWGDLDRDGRAEILTTENRDGPEDGIRDELANARRPRSRYRVYSVTEGPARASEPRTTFDAVGYAFEDRDARLPGGLRDLDGDGRQDLVLVTLDFSMLQAVRIVAAGSLRMGLDFGLLCQTADGRFRPVVGADLSGSFRLDLSNARLTRIPLFGGDFDGDGRADFVQLGRSDRLSIHRGGTDCRYSSEPDVEVRLAAAPRDLSLVEMTDLDGDARTDIVIVQPDGGGVRLDLYLSTGGSGE